MASERVLYIEPDKALVEVVQYNLETVNSYETLTAHTGEEGFLVAKRELPDVIVLELVLPDVDGLDLMRLLTSSHQTQHIPVIILTRRGEKSDELLGFAVGAQDYIVKPFSVKVFLTRLKTLLSNRPKVSVATENPNTAITVNPIFSNRSFNKKQNAAFVLMPFGLPWSNRVWNHLREIVAEEQFECKRADEIYGNNILEDIWTAINEATVVIADVTKRNPNVMYEVGIAHTLGKNVILLTQEVHDIPFDFRGYRHIDYADNTDGFQKLEIELPNYLRERRHDSSPLKKKTAKKKTAKKRIVKKKNR